MVSFKKALYYVLFDIHLSVTGRIFWMMYPYGFLLVPRWIFRIIGSWKEMIKKEIINKIVGVLRCFTKRDKKTR